MKFYTQDELSSIWQQLKDGTEPDEALVFSAAISTDTETEQMLILSTVPRQFNNSDNDSTESHYTRKRVNKEAVWGLWESNYPA